MTKVEPADVGDVEPQDLSDERDLQDSVSALARLSVGRLTLSDTLVRVAELAVRAIPDAEGAGLTLLESDRADTIVTTAPFVTQVDQVQYGLGQGPCVTAAREGSTVLSASLGNDRRWPQFGSRVARLGVHSALSIPLLTSEGVIGAMNIYARRKHAFDERAARVGELFAVPAAIAVQNAQVLAQTRRLAEQLQNALDTRSVIDRAIGILISRSGCSDDEALRRLRILSQNEHQKMRVVAQNIVDEAARRARAGRRS